MGVIVPPPTPIDLIIDYNDGASVILDLVNADPLHPQSQLVIINVPAGYVEMTFIINRIEGDAMWIWPENTLWTQGVSDEPANPSLGDTHIYRLHTIDEGSTWYGEVVRRFLQ